jgi:hypothetical protein
MSRPVRVWPVLTTPELRERAGLDLVPVVPSSRLLAPVAIQAAAVTSGGAPPPGRGFLGEQVEGAVLTLASLSGVVNGSTERELMPR